jgi:hypothetical protein
LSRESLIEKRKKEEAAAIKIQAFFRGIKCRQEFALLKAKSKVPQKFD